MEVLGLKDIFNNKTFEHDIEENKLQLEEIKEKILKLAESKDKHIFELDEGEDKLVTEIKKSFDLYDKDELTEIHKFINERFNEMTNIRAVTVGSFLGGSVDPTYNKCLPLHKISLSVNNEINTCSNILYYLYFINNEFKIINLTPDLKEGTVYFFVNYKTYDSFPGFSKKEKYHLIEKENLDEIRLISYYDNQYFDLVGEPIKIKFVKNRTEKTDSIKADEKDLITTKDCYNCDDNDWWVWAFFFVIVIIMIILLFYVTYYYW